MQRPTVHDLTGDHAIAQLARSVWLTAKAPTKAQPAVIDEIWKAVQDEEESDVIGFTLLLLEQLQAVERFLWPCYSDESSNPHVLLLVRLINVKRQEELPTWAIFANRPIEFSIFFRRVTNLSVDSSLAPRQRIHLLTFLVGAFQSLDNGLVRKECAPLVSIGTWHHLHSEDVIEKHLRKSAQLAKAWKAAGKKFSTADAVTQAQAKFERSWLYTLCLDFIDRLYNANAAVADKQDNLHYAERFLELLCDLLSQLPTRRYINTLLQDLNMSSAIRLSPLYQDGDDSALLRDLFQLFTHYAYFPLDDQTGQQLSEQQFEDVQNARMAHLQTVALRLHPDKLKILVLANYGLLSKGDEIQSHLDALSDAELVQFCDRMDLRTVYPEKSLVIQDRQFWTEVLISSVERRTPYAQIVREMHILPTEQSLYESNLLRTEDHSGARPLALPKLNLQYLSLGDFLWRSFILHRGEAFYEIRKHLEDTVSRMQPRQQGLMTSFGGFSRMAIPISKPAVIETVPPRVGEMHPAEVKVEIILDVSRLQPGLRREWESLRAGDVVFLLAVQGKDDSRMLTNGRNTQSDKPRSSIKTLRCAEIINVLDENSRTLKMERSANNDQSFRPKQRRLLVRLDPASYKTDKDLADAGKGDVYERINVVVRRTARENNFKRVLESLKQSTLVDVPIPRWFRDVFLGYGDPASASYKRLPNRVKKLDYRDTFLDWQHLIESLPGRTVEPDPNMNSIFPPPYVLEVEGSASSVPPPATASSKKRRRDQVDAPTSETAPAAESIRVTTYLPPNNGPYPMDAPKHNSIRFTPAQIEAIASGSQPGLTIIVGPPGTGKTDVTTQIISNIYHNFPQQRTLLIAHSNQALNQLFQKIVALDIDERHLLRLGHGEEELETEASFSKAGRIDSFLERGAYYLGQVNRLAASIQAPGAHGNSCETAEYFNQVYIEPRWKLYWDGIASGADVYATFPLTNFFADAPQPLFPANASREALIEIARGCDRHVKKIFAELADIRPFEILRAQRDKANYLLIKEARIIAMTSTHAAMRRQEIAQLGFRYDNVVMEEAAQITEAEGFVPLVMQNKTGPDGDQLLQRVVLVGDHLQNAPVIQSAAFKAYANLDQSLFQRLIRLGVPHIMLDAQGRSRASIAALYRWRYPQLTNLSIVSEQPEFVQANAGLRYDYQFVDVGDYKGQGETEPSPHFIQNLGEAEYAVALFQYMRLLGYPAERITILCAYAGQRALIRDVLTHRCKNHRLFGMPGWLGTVDKYQGEQNDYVILSLVRTKSPGYLRDLRRLTVALSRARLGLYVLGRRDVFASSLELRAAFEKLLARDAQLQLVTGEMFPATSRGVDDVDVAATPMENVEHLGLYVYEMTQAKVEALKNGQATLPPPTTAVTGHVEDEDVDEGENETAGGNGDDADDVAAGEDDEAI